MVNPFGLLNEIENDKDTTIQALRHNEVSPCTHIIITMEEPTEEAEASVIPMEIMIVGADLDLPWTTVHTVRRKAAKRSEEWYQKDTTARKKRRLEEPILPRRRSTRRKKSSSTVTPDPSAAVNASTFRESPHQTQTKLPPVETIEAELNAGHDATADVGNLPDLLWEERLSELAEYRRVFGNCNVPYNYVGNSKLHFWVLTQRRTYRKRLEGKISSMTPYRIQKLESIGFEWRIYLVWEDRLSELTNYCKIQGHCNVPSRYSENIQLGTWVRKQRSNYKFYQQGKTSSITPSRIQELESLGFEWEVPPTGGRKPRR
jgi:hypothetical protein